MLTRSISALLRRPSNFGLAPQKVKNVRFGGGGGGFVSKKRKPGEWDVDAEEHVAGTFDSVMAKVLGVTLWLWIFTSMKADNGKFLGLYSPWLHAHEHPPHLEFELRQDGGYDE
mmetsp:Transcript_25437/g.42876  ORF Transcript_25437/g.42876 Transcript_25437/m.42876 type:complete len:114 (-) Transcript_25437:1811-2152(-)